MPTNRAGTVADSKDQGQGWPQEAFLGNLMGGQLQPVSGNHRPPSSPLPAPLFYAASVGLAVPWPPAPRHGSQQCLEHSAWLHTPSAATGPKRSSAGPAPPVC